MCNVCCANQALRSGGITHDRLGIKVRAWGRAEFSPAVYQIKRIGERWPEYWHSSLDLAGDITKLGFDTVPNDPDYKITEDYHKEALEKANKEIETLLRRQEIYSKRYEELSKFREKEYENKIPEVPIEQLKKINEGQDNGN